MKTLFSQLWPEAQIIWLIVKHSETEEQWTKNTGQTLHKTSDIYFQFCCKFPIYIPAFAYCIVKFPYFQIEKYFTHWENVLPLKNILMVALNLSYCIKYMGFPGGSVVKNPPANARDMGLILDPGDPTCCRAAKPMHHNYWACALEPGSHNHWSPHTLEPELRNKRSQCNEKS